MSTRTEQETLPVSNFAQAAIFIFFVITAAVFITAGSLIWDVMSGNYITPANLLN